MSHAPPSPLPSSALLWGGTAIAAFSATLPATRVALELFAPTEIALGRIVLAALPALALLLVTRSPLPTRAQWRRLVWVVAGVSFGFPLCSALAMQENGAASGAVALSGLPLITALWARFRAGERPSGRFWIGALTGAAAVALFMARPLVYDDGWLLLAAVAGGIGYAEGGALAREVGGWRVITWAIIFAAPLALLALLLSGSGWPSSTPLAPWLALVYLALISQFAAFFAWYHALAQGIAQISQLQLLQPFFTIALAVIWLGEPWSAELPLFALVVVASVALTQRPRLPQPKKRVATP